MRVYSDISAPRLSFSGFLVKWRHEDEKSWGIPHWFPRNPLSLSLHSILDRLWATAGWLFLSSQLFATWKFIFNRILVCVDCYGIKINCNSFLAIKLVKLESFLSSNTAPFHNSFRFSRMMKTNFSNLYTHRSRRERKEKDNFLDLE